MNIACETYILMHQIKINRYQVPKSASIVLHKRQANNLRVLLVPPQRYESVATPDEKRLACEVNSIKS